MLKKEDLAKLAMTVLLTASGASLQANTNDPKSEGVFLAKSCSKGGCGSLADTSGDMQRGSYSSSSYSGADNNAYGSDNANGSYSKDSSNKDAGSARKTTTESYSERGYNTNAAPNYTYRSTTVEHETTEAPLNNEDQAFLRQLNTEVSNEKLKDKLNAIYRSLDREHRDIARERARQVRNAASALQEAQNALIERKNTMHNSSNNSNSNSYNNSNSSNYNSR